MEEPVLIVDDDENVLSGIKRQLYGKYDLATASSGQEALEILKKRTDYHVVISDYKMPGMNGIELLGKTRKLSPETVRMMLTGQADMEAIVNVINEGNIFRFLTKPCPAELLIKNIEDGIAQYHLMQSEKELLSKTLGGALQVMTDMMVLAKPQAFNRGQRILDLLKRFLDYVKIEDSWQVQIAAMLSQIGCVTVPDAILDKIYRNQPSTEEERMIFQMHTKTSSEIIRKIPRLDKVARIIEYQEKYYNGSGFPMDEVKGRDIPLGSRILRIILDYDQLLQTGMGIDDAIQAIRKRNGWYDEKLMDAFIVSQRNIKKKKVVFRDVTVEELNRGMFLAEDVVSASGMVLGNKRQAVTEAFRITMRNLLARKEVKEPINVMIYIE